MVDNLSRSKNAVRGAIANKADLAEEIGSELATLLPDEFDAFAKWISAYAMRQRPLIKTSAAKTYKDLNSLGCVAAPQLGRQLMWSIAILGLHEEQVREFVRLADEFEAKWLIGDADAALSKLDDIDSVCGRSLWSIENRVALLHQSKGLEAQKSFVVEVTKAAPGSVAGFVAFYISIRNEEATSLAKFLPRTSAVINRQRVGDPAKAYLRSIIADERAATPGELRDVLAYASSVSLIDLFCALRRALKQAATDATYRSSWPTFLALAVNLAKVDVSLVPYVELFGGAITRPAVSNLAADAYWEGDYDTAISLAAARLGAHPEDVSQLSVMAASIRNLAETGKELRASPPYFARCWNRLRLFS